VDFNFKINGYQGIAYMAMVVIAFLIMLIWGKDANGRKNGWGMTLLIAFFVPMLTPMMAAMAIRSSIKERSFKLFGFGLVSVLLVIIQVIVMYALRTVRV
jgi:hypothetical protein